VPESNRHRERIQGRFVVLFLVFLYQGDAMRHDQLFKAVLQNCFDDFLKLFYPDVAERLDFATLRFLEKELFTDFPEGSRREADVVAEVKTRDGDPELVLVHVEVQSRSERDFGRRMFRYYMALLLRYSAPVFPVVLFLHGGSGLSLARKSIGLPCLGAKYIASATSRSDWRTWTRGSILGRARWVLRSRR